MQTALAEWSYTGYIDDEIKVVIPLAVMATLYPMASGAHDEVFMPKEQGEMFPRKAKSLGGVMEELGRYTNKQNNK